MSIRKEVWKAIMKSWEGEVLVPDREGTPELRLQGGKVARERWRRRRGAAAEGGMFSSIRAEIERIGRASPIQVPHELARRMIEQELGTVVSERVVDFLFSFYHGATTDNPITLNRLKTALQLCRILDQEQAPAKPATP
ncbi:MAG: hypothetical protein ACREIQ_13175 [Nitrospiria bacterium]